MSLLIYSQVNFASTKQTSSTPTAEAEKCLKNVAKYNQYTNAFVDLNQPDHIRSQAAEATRRWESGMFCSITTVEYFIGLVLKVLF